MLDAVLFDLDGTLIEPRVGIVQSIVFALECLGLVAPEEPALLACIGPPLRDSFARLLDTDDEEVLGRAVGLYRERFKSQGVFENELYHGIRDVLTGCELYSRSRFVVTAKPEVYATQIINHHGLSDVFDGVYGPALSDRLSGKECLVDNVVRAHEIDPKKSVVVGDRSYDVVAGLAHGMRTIGVTYGYGGQTELEEAGVHHLVTTPAELSIELQRLAECLGA